MQLDQTQLGRFNRARVLLEIHKQKAFSRTQLAKTLGLSLMAVTRIVRDLIAAGLVEEGEKSVRTSSPGRRRTSLALVSEGAYVLGLSINAYEPSVSLANLRGEILLRRAFPLDVAADRKYALAFCAERLKELVATAGVDRRRVLGLGVVLSGVVDHRKGIAVSLPFLGWEATEIAGPLKRAVGVPVAVDNLTNALLLAEVSFGVAAGKRSVMFFRNAIGLAGSLFLDGQLVRGARFGAGQIGHMPVAGAMTRCSCGQIGCLNTVCSGAAVLAELGSAVGPVLSPEGTRSNKAQLDRVLGMATRGDERTREVLFRAGCSLGEALLSIAVAVDPEQILLSGPLSSSPSYRDGLNAGLSRLLSGSNDLVMTSTMEDSRAAALLAMSELVFSGRITLRPLPKGRSGPVARRSGGGDRRGNAAGA